MSFATTSPHRSDPAATTTTTNTTTTTVTTTVTGPQTTSAAPTISSRGLVGWHARQLKFSWDKPTDQHKYRNITGLPAVHAAVINNDWAFAAEALCPDDIGIPWIPHASQRTAKTNNPYLTSAAWATTLPSLDPEKQKSAIIQMAIDRVEKTTVSRGGALYGSNLLTLCLQLPAPADFTQKLITFTAEKAPQYLNLPDANGCTALYLAVQRGDAEQAALLLHAGANPQAPCAFQLHDDELSVISAYSEALQFDDDTIFVLFLEKILDSVNWEHGYPINEDPLQLERWCQSQNEETIQKLANKFDAIKNPLLNFDDKTGSSIVYRTLQKRQPLSAGVTPLYRGNPETGAIFAAAVSGDIRTFIKGINNFPCCSNDLSLNGASQKEMEIYFLLQSNTLNEIEKLFEESSARVSRLRKSDFENDLILSELIKYFIKNNSTDNIKDFLKECPKATKIFYEIVQSNFLFKQCEFENFSAAMEAAWPALKEFDKWIVLLHSSSASSRHTAFITSLPGFTAMINFLPGDHYFVRGMLFSMGEFSVKSGNAVAYEIAAAHSVALNKLIESMHSGSADLDRRLVDQEVIGALKAGSVLWFDKFLQAGLNLQDLLDAHGDEVLPLMADLNPSGLMTWLQDLNLRVTHQMIDQARTSEGKATLADLMQAQAISLSSDM